MKRWTLRIPVRTWRLLRSLPKGALGMIIFVSAACALGVTLVESRVEEDSGWGEIVTIYDTDDGLFYTLITGYVPLSHPDPPAFGTVEFDVYNSDTRLLGQLIYRLRGVAARCSVCGPPADPRSDLHILAAIEAFDSVRAQEITELLQRNSARTYWTGVAGAAVSLVFSIISTAAVALLALSWIDDVKNAKMAHLMQRGRCPRCGYDLRGQRHERTETGRHEGLEAGCPECGWGRENAQTPKRSNAQSPE